MGCYGVTDDLQDEINDLNRENKKLKETIGLLEQELNKLDKELERSRKRISGCFKTIYKLKNDRF